jgi:phosphoglycolate phosphatase
MTLPKAVIFDLDGTLIDSAPDLCFALNRLLANEGRRELTLKEVIGMIGDGVPKLVERGYKATGDLPEPDDLSDKVGVFGRDYEINATAHTSLFAGALDVLGALREAGVLIGLCTNKPVQATLEILAEFEVEGFFTSIVGGDTLNGVRKPDPRHLQAVLEDLNVTADEAVMVGDSANDINVAKNAGVKAIAVTFGYCHGPVEDLDTDAQIDHFDELLPALAALV